MTAPSAMMACGFLCAASVLAARGSSQAPGTFTTSISVAPARFRASSAPSSSRSVTKLLNRAHTTANFRPLASRSSSIGFPSVTFVGYGILEVQASFYRMDPAFIRNFSIIAHIDHGKSTLADRLLEATGALQQREMMEQVLDTMDLERERGITIKAHAVRLNYRAEDGQMYQLNLIDTPGHVDFTYEVSRSLQACEGALLVVDASQGVEAQTLANTYLALNHNLEIIPVINKIDLPSAEPERIREQIEQVIGLPAKDAILVSAKQGTGIKDVLEAIVHLVPPPQGSPDAPLRALIFDSWFDPYRGVIILTRVFDGRLRVGQKIKLWSNDTLHEVEGLGYQSPKPIPCDELAAGEVGFLFANIKTVSDAKIGDTITSVEDPASEPLPGFEEVKAMVFAGLYPVESHEHGRLREALEKLRLNDSA